MIVVHVIKLCFMGPSQPYWKSLIFAIFNSYYKRKFCTFGRAFCNFVIGLLFLYRLIALSYRNTRLLKICNAVDQMCKIYKWKFSIAWDDFKLAKIRKGPAIDHAKWTNCIMKECYFSAFVPSKECLHERFFYRTTELYGTRCGILRSFPQAVNIR